MEWLISGFLEAVRAQGDRVLISERPGGRLKTGQEGVIFEAKRVKA